MDQTLINALAQFGVPSVIAGAVMLAFYRTHLATQTANEKFMAFFINEQRTAQRESAEKLERVLEAQVQSANAQTKTAEQLQALVQELKNERQYEQPRRPGAR